jgi:hypothetical protein
MFFWDAHQWCYSWKLKEKAKWSMQLVDFIILQKIICQKVGKMCFFSLKMSFPAYVFHYGELKNWGKRWKKNRILHMYLLPSIFFILFRGCFDRQDYTTKFEASLYQCCVGTQFRGLEVPNSISKIWSKIGSDFWNWNLVTTKNCNQICNK